MIYDREHYDWQAREDAETLQRVQAIKSDPERLKRAQDCIRASVEQGKAVLKSTHAPAEASPAKKQNPATVAYMGVFGKIR